MMKDEKINAKCERCKAFSLDPFASLHLCIKKLTLVKTGFATCNLPLATYFVKVLHHLILDSMMERR